MESTPSGYEIILNAKLGQFAHRVLNNDTCAAAIINRLNALDGSTDGARLLGGEPCIWEQDSRLVGGIQIGYERTDGATRSRTFLYIDLFYFDPEIGGYEPAEAVATVL